MKKIAFTYIIFLLCALVFVPRVFAVDYVDIVIEAPSGFGWHGRYGVGGGSEYRVEDEGPQSFRLFRDPSFSDWYIGAGFIKNDSGNWQLTVSIELDGVVYDTASTTDEYGRVSVDWGWHEPRNLPNPIFLIAAIFLLSLCVVGIGIIIKRKILI